MTTITMTPQKFRNPEAKRLFLEALRSGAYKQGSDVLCRNVEDDSEWCCLGVLSDQAQRRGVHVDVSGPDDSGNIYFDGCHQYPPLSVARWAGLEGRAGDGDSSNSVGDIHVEVDREFSDWWYDETIKDGGDVRWQEGDIVGLGEMNDAGVPFPALADLCERVM